MECLTNDTVLDVLGGWLGQPIEEHLDECEACRRLVSEVARAKSGELGAHRADFGRYRLGERIGAGSMGRVYAAQDPQLDRTVAVKVVRTAAGDQQRLLAEARIMARLSHPNLVPVFDVGLEGAVLFVVMEYWRGQTVADWARAHRPWREVVAAYLQAGRGLAAAHAARVFHGDIKPQNLLIREDGRVGVTDFGLAAALDEAVERGSGTPAYMAPEQYLGNTVDERSDQFSFCVALYEGLYGERPFAGKTARDLAREVIAGRVRRPREGRKVPARVRRVVLRGLSSAPGARFTSMSQLLAALSRAEHRPFVALLSIAVVLLAALWWGASPSRLEACERRAPGVEEVWNEARAAELKRTFDAAGASSAVAPSVRGLNEWVDDWKADRRATCQSTTLTQEELGGHFACLEWRRAELATLVELLQTPDATVAIHAVEMVAGLGDISTCGVPSSGRLLATSQQPAQQSLKRAIGRARVLRAAGRLDEALATITSAVADARALPDRVSEAEAGLLLGAVLQELDRWADAEGALRAAELAAEAGHQHEFKVRAEIALVYLVGFTQGRAEEGFDWERRARASLEGLGPNPSLEATLETNVATIFSHLGRVKEARAHDENALRLLRSLARAGPALSNTLNNLANSCLDSGDYDGAIGFARDALRFDEPRLGPSHPQLVEELINLGNALSAVGKPDEALVHLERAAAIAEHSADVVLVEEAIAQALRLRGDAAAAGQHLRHALEVAEPDLGADHPEVPFLHAQLAAALLDEGLADQAVPHVLRAITLRQRESVRPALAVALTALGRLEAARAHQGKAVTAFEEAIEILEDELRREDALIEPLLGLGAARLALGQRDGAATALQRAANLLAATPGRDPERRQAHALLARVADTPSAAGRADAR